eukprot:365983-Chlamydomonas_euryale.AAC.28
MLARLGCRLELPLPVLHVRRSLSVGSSEQTVSSRSHARLATLSCLAVMQFCRPHRSAQRGPLLPCQEELGEPKDDSAVTAGIAMLLLPLLVLAPFPSELLVALDQIGNATFEGGSGGFGGGYDPSIPPHLKVVSPEARSCDVSLGLQDARGSTRTVRDQLAFHTKLQSMWQHVATY